MEQDAELQAFINANGKDYALIRRVPGNGICGLQRMIFTVGLFYGMDMWNIGGRYCYHTLAEAVHALATWDGTGDAPGNWIKRFGDKGEMLNPNYESDSSYSS